MKLSSKIQFSRTLSITIISVFIFASLSNAQVLPTGDGLTLTPSTENPVPGQNITIKASSNSMNVSSAVVKWSVNGKTVKEGIGETVLEVKAPALGSKLEIDASATDPSGTVVDGSTIIGSGMVDMIVESSGYVPPLFLGKYPISYENTLKIIAVPHLADSSGKELNPATLVYQWKKDGRVVSDSSGYGKQSFILSSEIIPNAVVMSVSVSNREGGLQTVGKVTLEPQKQSVLFYVNDSLYGTLFNRAIGDNINIGSQRETGVLAVPYGFDLGSAISWMINGVNRPELSNKASIILRSPVGGSGSSAVSINVTHAKYLSQSAGRDFTASFKADTNNSSVDNISL